MQDSDIFFLTNDNKTLTGIDEMNCPSEIQVPYGVTKIEKRAFADCPAKKIILPDSVTEIGAEAFCGSDALEYVRLPKQLSSIGPAAFRGCLSLEKVDMSDTIANFPESLFECCPSLKEIPFRSGITELSRNVFSECSSITSLIIPEGVAIIRSGAMGYCQNLQTVVLPSTIKLIEDDAFRNCPNLAHIRFGLENPAFFVDENSGCLFARRESGTFDLIKVPVSATEIRIPKIVIHSHSEAFQGCDALEKVYIDCDFVEHPIFVALKTEIVNAQIIDETQLAEEVKEEPPKPKKPRKPRKPKAEKIEEPPVDSVVEENDFAEPDEEPAVFGEQEEPALEEPVVEEAAAFDEQIEEPETTAEEFDVEEPVIEEPVIFDEQIEEEPVVEEESVAEDEAATEEAPATADSLLADILEQNIGAEETPEEEEDELKGITITPEEFDEAVQRGIQEEEEIEYKIPEGVLPSQAAQEEEELPPQEPRFVNGMQSVSSTYEVIGERALYPDRAEADLCQYAPIEMEDITTLVVVTESVTEDNTISENLKNFCIELAKKYELKRIYFFGALGLDNEEFLYGFGKFALYRNVVYAAKASDYDSLSAEIKSFAEIAEINSPVTPFQNVCAPDALELEKPFKIFVQDSDGAAQEAKTEDIEIEEPVVVPESEPVAKPALSGKGLLQKAQAALDAAK